MCCVKEAIAHFAERVLPTFSRSPCGGRTELAGLSEVFCSCAVPAASVPQHATAPNRCAETASLGWRTHSCPICNCCRPAKCSTPGAAIHSNAAGHTRAAKLRSRPKGASNVVRLFMQQGCSLHEPCTHNTSTKARHHAEKITHTLRTAPGLSLQARTHTCGRCMPKKRPKNTMRNSHNWRLLHSPAPFRRGTQRLVYT